MMTLLHYFYRQQRSTIETKRRCLKTQQQRAVGRHVVIMFLRMIMMNYCTTFYLFLFIVLLRLSLSWGLLYNNKISTIPNYYYDYNSCHPKQQQSRHCQQLPKSIYYDNNNNHNNYICSSLRTRLRRHARFITTLTSLQQQEQQKAFIRYHNNMKLFMINNDDDDVYDSNHTDYLIPNNTKNEFNIFNVPTNKEQQLMVGLPDNNNDALLSEQSSIFDGSSSSSISNHIMNNHTADHTNTHNDNDMVINSSKSSLKRSRRRNWIGSTKVQVLNDALFRRAHSNDTLKRTTTILPTLNQQNEQRQQRHLYRLGIHSYNNTIDLVKQNHHHIHRNIFHRIWNMISRKNQVGSSIVQDNFTSSLVKSYHPLEENYNNNANKQLSILGEDDNNNLIDVSSTDVATTTNSVIMNNSESSSLATTTLNGTITQMKKKQKGIHQNPIGQIQSLLGWITLPKSKTNNISTITINESNDDDNVLLEKNMIMNDTNTIVSNNQDNDKTQNSNNNSIVSSSNENRTQQNSKSSLLSDYHLIPLNIDDRYHKSIKNTIIDNNDNNNTNRYGSFSTPWDSRNTTSSSSDNINNNDDLWKNLGNDGFDAALKMISSLPLPTIMSVNDNNINNNNYENKPSTTTGTAIDHNISSGNGNSSINNSSCTTSHNSSHSSTKESPTMNKILNTNALLSPISPPFNYTYNYTTDLINFMKPFLERSAGNYTTDYTTDFINFIKPFMDSNNTHDYTADFANFMKPFIEISTSISNSGSSSSYNTNKKMELQRQRQMVTAMARFVKNKNPNDILTIADLQTILVDSIDQYDDEMIESDIKSRNQIVSTKKKTMTEYDKSKGKIQKSDTTSNKKVGGKNRNVAFPQPSVLSNRDLKYGSIASGGALGILVGVSILPNLWLMGGIIGSIYGYDTGSHYNMTIDDNDNESNIIQRIIVSLGRRIAYKYLVLYDYWQGIFFMYKTGQLSYEYYKSYASLDDKFGIQSKIDAWNAKFMEGKVAFDSWEKENEVGRKVLATLRTVWLVEERSIKKMQQKNSIMKNKLSKYRIVQFMYDVLDEITIILKRLWKVLTGFILRGRGMKEMKEFVLGLYTNFYNNNNNNIINGQRFITMRGRINSSIITFIVAAAAGSIFTISPQIVCMIAIIMGGILWPSWIDEFYNRSNIFIIETRAKGRGEKITSSMLMSSKSTTPYYLKSKSLDKNRYHYYRTIDGKKKYYRVGQQSWYGRWINRRNNMKNMNNRKSKKSSSSFDWSFLPWQSNKPDPNERNFWPF